MPRLDTLARLLALSCTFIAPAFAQQAPMVREGAAVKVSEHVFVIPDDNVPGVPNVGIIVGRDGILVVDTGMGERNGAIVLKEARRLGGDKPLWLVTTHVHPEHDLGASAFPATTKMIRSRAQVDEIATAGMQTADAFRRRSPEMRALLEGAKFRDADIVFDTEHEVNLGDVKARLLAMGANHTAGDTVIVVDQDHVLFSGDLAMKPLPAFASPKSSLAHWLTSLDRLDALKPRIVVPSHGPTGDAGFIAGYRRYLTRIRDRAAELKRAGKSLEETTQTITAELKSEYPDTGRVGGAVRSAYAEAG